MTLRIWEAIIGVLFYIAAGIIVGGIILLIFYVRHELGLSDSFWPAELEDVFEKIRDKRKEN